jgi:hypothetical protein
MARFTPLGVLALLLATACKTDTVPREADVARSEPVLEPAPAIQLSRAERMAAIQKDYDDAVAAWRTAFKEASKDVKTPEERQAVSEKLPRPDPAPFRARARALVDEDPKDEVAIDAITWLMIGGSVGTDRDELLAILEAHHLRSAKVGAVCGMLANTHTGRASALLERIIAENPHHDVVGKACFEMAQSELLEVGSARRAQARTDPAQIDEWKERVGAERAAALLALDAAAQEKHAEKLLTRVVDEFADVDHYGQPLGEQAANALFELHNLAVGMLAPEIEGEDLAGTTFKLSDYRGKVVMLDYWGNW